MVFAFLYHLEYYHIGLQCFQAKIQYSHATLDNMTGPADNAFGQHMMLQSKHSFLNIFLKKKNCIFNSIGIFPNNQNWFLKKIENTIGLSSRFKLHLWRKKSKIILWDSDKKIFIINIRIWLLLYKVAVDFWTSNLFSFLKKKNF